MTADAFRKVALSMPEAVESAHMHHPDFRVRKKIFATLGYPNGEWGMVKLCPEHQRKWVEAEPKMFSPVKGKWGLQGATSVNLKAATALKLKRAMLDAWWNAAPEELR